MPVPSRTPSKRRGGCSGVPTDGGIAVKYLLMIYGNQEKWESMPAEAWRDAIARQEAFNAKYRGTGELLGAYGLADAVNAKLVRRAEGVPAVTDGPYLETKEYLASF